MLPTIKLLNLKLLDVTKLSLHISSDTYNVWMNVFFISQTNFVH